MKQREEMAGGNLRDGLVEVALEQWTERMRPDTRMDGVSVGFNAVSALEGSNIGAVK